MSKRKCKIDEWCALYFLNVIIFFITCPFLAVSIPAFFASVPPLCLHRSPRRPVVDQALPVAVMPGPRRGTPSRGNEQCSASSRLLTLEPWRPTVLHWCKRCFGGQDGASNSNTVRPHQQICQPRRMMFLHWQEIEISTPRCSTPRNLLRLSLRDSNNVQTWAKSEWHPSFGASLAKHTAELCVLYIRRPLKGASSLSPADVVNTP